MIALTVAFSQPVGQGWEQLAELGLAFVLCAAIGLERELRQRAAGLRTHTLVGLGSALFVMVSKYGFFDVLGEHVTLDPSRVAAQVVSGIGFIGGGLIFVRRDAVRGLTTAAVIWIACAVGMAAGAGLPVLAVAVTAGHFLVAYGLTPLSRRLPGSKHAVRDVRLSYLSGRGALRQVLALCTDRGFTVVELVSSSEPARAPVDDPGEGAVTRPEAHPVEQVSVILRLRGVGPVAELAADAGEVSGVLGVSTGVSARDD